MSTVLLVGGAAATGKSTLVTSLIEAFGATPVRPSDSYLRVAAARGIPPTRAFFDVAPGEAEEDFVSLCAPKPVVVSDLHYAIQFERDSAMAVGEESAYRTEPYVATVRPELITRLQAANCNVVAILLETTAQVAFARADARPRPRRADSVAEVQKEMEAERVEWERVAAIPGVTGLAFDTTVLTVAKTRVKIAPYL